MIRAGSLLDHRRTRSLVLVLSGMFIFPAGTVCQVCDDAAFAGIHRTNVLDPEPLKGASIHGDIPLKLARATHDPFVPINIEKVMAGFKRIEMQNRSSPFGVGIGPLLLSLAVMIRVLTGSFGSKRARARNAAQWTPQIARLQSRTESQSGIAVESVASYCWEPQLDELPSTPEDIGEIRLPLGAFTPLVVERRQFWLLFNRDAHVRYYPTVPPEHTVCPYRTPIRAGQLVRVVDGGIVDDGLGHEPTLRPNLVVWNYFEISDPDDVQEVEVLPSFHAMQRLYKRSSDDVAFWKAMLAEPNNELPRWIYADYLDERGDTAGSIVRGRVPLALHYSVEVGGTWERRNSRKASWQVAVSQLQRQVGSGGIRLVELQPGYGLLGLARLAVRRRHGFQFEQGEWQCLSVSMASGEPIPPFVNYLLVQMALLGLHPTRAGG